MKGEGAFIKPKPTIFILYLHELTYIFRGSKKYYFFCYNILPLSFIKYVFPGVTAQPLLLALCTNLTASPLFLDLDYIVSESPYATINHHKRLASASSYTPATPITPNSVFEPATPSSAVERERDYNAIVSRQLMRTNDPLYASIPEDIGGKSEGRELFVISYIVMGLDKGKL